MPCSLPFQREAGIHTSKRMSESFDGLMLPATRQSAGTVSVAPAGVLNGPAATDSAVVIVVLGSVRDVRLSHVAGRALPADCAPSVEAIAITDTERPNARIRRITG